MKKYFFLLIFATFCVYADAQQPSSNFNEYYKKISGIMLDAKGDYSSQWRCYNEFASAHPDEAPLLALALGRVILDKRLEDKFSLALEYFDRAYESAPQSDVNVRSKALYNKGLAYFYNSSDLGQDFNKAFSYFNQAVSYSSFASRDPISREAG